MITLFYLAYRDRVILAGIILLASFNIGCQFDPHVSIDGQNPPTFKITGTGNLYYFWVVEIGTEDQLASSASREKDPIWKVIPETATSNRIAELPSIRYGDVPPGFKQTVPENGPPPALKEGIVYCAGGPTYNTDSGAGMCFIIREGKPIKVSWHR